MIIIMITNNDNDKHTIHEFPRRDSKPKKGLQENRAIIRIEYNRTACSGRPGAQNTM